MYVYRAAGENLELARSELEGFLQSQGMEPEVRQNGRLFFSDSEPMEGQLKRLALFHEVGEVVEAGEVEFEGSFRVDAVVLDGDHDSQELEQSYGEKLNEQGREVDLENPATVFTVYALGNEEKLVRRLVDIDRGLYEERSNEKRPFSSPVSLDPVLARVMVNLSGVKPGEFLLDPFCGTGGILIEAGLCGVGVKGLDIESEMVEGTRKNLEKYGILVHDLKEADFSESPQLFDPVDAMVTDLPYGRSSPKEGELDGILEVAEKLCDGKLVFAYHEPGFGGLQHAHEVFVHGTLTRYIYVQDLS